MEKAKIMLEKCKQVLLNTKKWVWVLVAGIVIAFVAWKKHLADEIAGVHEAKKEEEIKQQGKKKLEEETAKIDAEKAKKTEEAEKEKTKKEAEIKATELKEKVRLNKLAKQNTEEFKKEVTKKLGVGEKKKGRPKKQ